MDWITGIQRAVDYVEAHITDEINYEETARQAYSSSFHFQRVFSIICGFTLGDYIRFRRLSLAGNELASSDARILDVAIKYGYESQESFSRAFIRFHGISPSQAKSDGANLKSFTRLSVKLILDGGNTMDYRIEKKDAFKIIAKKKRISSKTEMTTAEISEFWNKCAGDGTIPALCGYIPKDNIFSNAIVGVCFGNDATQDDFPYAIGAMYNGAKVKEKDFTIDEIPAHTYAIFKCVGPMPGAFRKLYNQIYTEFFPASEYQPCGGTDFEAYPAGDVTSPDYTCELWISVEKKK